MFRFSPHRSLLNTSVLASALAAAALLSACAVGPDYRGPPIAAPVASAAGQFHGADAAQTPAAPPPARWWEALNDPQLTALIDRALTASPTVREAQARLRSARASLGQSRAKLAPSGGGSLLEASARLPTGALGAITGAGGSSDDVTNVNLYSAGFDATWELDVFGGTRRAIESADAQAGAQEAQLHDTQVELAAEVAQVYVALRDAQTRLQLSRDDLALQQRGFELTQQRRAHGVAADGDIERVQTDLAQTEAQVAPLEGQVQQSLDQIAVLTGAEPGALDTELAQSAAPPAPPAATPVGDPAAMLRRRPDIRAAERRLAASNAVIGQNVAQFFPSVSLLGDIGFASTDPGQLFRADRFSAIGAPSLSWNILNFPKIQAQVRGAKADRDAAAAHYQGVVLSALQDAEASLSRYGHQRQSLVALARAEASADRAQALTAQRYQGGTASLIDALDAQRQSINARQALAQGQAQLSDDYIALQKSLGLGWTS